MNNSNNMTTKHINPKKLWFKAVAIGLIVAFLVNQVSYAMEPDTFRKNLSTLSPASRFIYGDNFVIDRDSARISELASSLQEDAGLLYVSRLISRVLDSHGTLISAKGLRTLIKRHIPQIEENTSFILEDLYKEGNTYCLPYRNKEDGVRQALRFYLSTDNPEEAAGKPSISAGLGEVRIVNETLELERSSLYGVEFQELLGLLSAHEKEGTFERAETGVDAEPLKDSPIHSLLQAIRTYHGDVPVNDLFLLDFSILPKHKEIDNKTKAELAKAFGHIHDLIGETVNLIGFPEDLKTVSEKDATDAIRIVLALREDYTASVDRAIGEVLEIAPDLEVVHDLLRYYKSRSIDFFDELKRRYEDFKETKKRPSVSHEEEIAAAEALKNSNDEFEIAAALFTLSQPYKKKLEKLAAEGQLEGHANNQSLPIVVLSKDIFLEIRNKGGLAGKRILEVGPSYGVFMYALKELSRLGDLDLDIVGIEVDVRRAEYARNLGGLNVITGDITAPPEEVQKEQFDYVVVSWPYFEIYELSQIEEFLTGCYKMTAPGGRCVIVTNYDQNGPDFDLIPAICRRVGFEAEYRTDFTGALFLSLKRPEDSVQEQVFFNEEMFDEVRSVSPSQGEALEIKWHEDISTQEIIDFYNYLKNLPYVEAEMRDYYLRTLLFSIVASAFDISKTELLKPLGDLLCGDTGERHMKDHAKEFRGQAAAFTPGYKPPKMVYDFAQGLAGALAQESSDSELMEALKGFIYRTELIASAGSGEEKTPRAVRGNALIQGGRAIIGLAGKGALNFSVSAVPRGNNHKRGIKLSLQDSWDMTEMFAYSTPLEEDNKKRGLTGVFLSSDLRGKGFFRGLLNIFFTMYPDIRQTHPMVTNPALLYMLMREYGFAQEEGLEPNIWFRHIKEEDGIEQPELTEHKYLLYYKDEDTAGKFSHITGTEQYYILEEMPEEGLKDFQPMCLGEAFFVKDESKFNEALASFPVSLGMESDEKKTDTSSESGSSRSGFSNAQILLIVSLATAGLAAVIPTLINGVPAVLNALNLTHATFLNTILAASIPILGMSLFGGSREDEFDEKEARRILRQLFHPDEYMRMAAARDLKKMLVPKDAARYGGFIVGMVETLQRKFLDAGEYEMVREAALIYQRKLHAEFVIEGGSVESVLDLFSSETTSLTLRKAALKFLIEARYLSPRLAVSIFQAAVRNLYYETDDALESLMVKVFARLIRVPNPEEPFDGRIVKGIAEKVEEVAETGTMKIYIPSYDGDRYFTVALGEQAQITAIRQTAVRFIQIVNFLELVMQVRKEEFTEMPGGKIVFFPENTRVEDAIAAANTHAEDAWVRAEVNFEYSYLLFSDILNNWHNNSSKAMEEASRCLIIVTEKWDRFLSRYEEHPYFSGICWRSSNKLRDILTKNIYGPFYERGRAPFGDNKIINLGLAGILSRFGLPVAPGPKRIADAITPLVFDSDDSIARQARQILTTIRDKDPLMRKDQKLERIIKLPEPASKRARKYGSSFLGVLLAVSTAVGVVSAILFLVSQIAPSADVMSGLLDFAGVGVMLWVVNAEGDDTGIKRSLDAMLERAVSASESFKENHALTEYVSLVQMVPTHFLTNPDNVDVSIGSSNNPRINKIIERIVQGEFSQLDLRPIRIDIKKDGSISIYEGQHRLEAFKRVGVAHVPAQVVYWDKELIGDYPFEAIVKGDGDKWDVARSLTDYSATLYKAGAENILERALINAKVYVDAGCGVGRAAVEAARMSENMQLGLKVYGVDAFDWGEKDVKGILSEKNSDFLWEEFKAERDRLEQNGYYSFIQGDITDVTLPSKADVITSLFVLQYVKDPLKALVNLYNQLNEGGELIVMFVAPKGEKTPETYAAFLKGLSEKHDAWTAGLTPVDIDSKDADGFFVSIRKFSNQTADLDFILSGSKKTRVTIAGESFDILSPTYHRAEGGKAGSEKALKALVSPDKLAKMRTMQIWVDGDTDKVTVRISPRFIRDLSIIAERNEELATSIAYSVWLHEFNHTFRGEDESIYLNPDETQANYLRGRTYQYKNIAAIFWYWFLYATDDYQYEMIDAHSTEMFLEYVARGKNGFEFLLNNEEVKEAIAKLIIEYKHKGPKKSGYGASPGVRSADISKTKGWEILSGAFSKVIALKKIDANIEEVNTTFIVDEDFWDAEGASNEGGLATQTNANTIEPGKNNGHLTLPSELRKVAESELIKWNASFVQKEAILTGELAELIALHADLPPPEQEFLRKAGYAHDIGKKWFKWYFDSPWKAPGWIRTFFSLLHPELTIIILQLKGINLLPWEKEVLRHHSYIYPNSKQSLSITRRCNTILVIADQLIARYIPRKYKKYPLKQYNHDITIKWIEMFFDPSGGIEGEGRGVLPQEDMDLIDVLESMEKEEEFRSLMERSLKDVPDVKKPNEPEVFSEAKSPKQIAPGSASLQIISLGTEYDEKLEQAITRINANTFFKDDNGKTRSLAVGTNAILKAWKDGIVEITAAIDREADKVLGFIVTNKGKKFFVLEAIGVEPAYKHLQIGKMLMLKALTEAKANKSRKFGLDCIRERLWFFEAFNELLEERLGKNISKNIGEYKPRPDMTQIGFEYTLSRIQEKEVIALYGEYLAKADENVSARNTAQKELFAAFNAGKRVPIKVTGIEYFPETSLPSGFKVSYKDIIDGVVRRDDTKVHFWDDSRGLDYFVGTDAEVLILDPGDPAKNRGPLFSMRPSNVNEKGLTPEKGKEPKKKDKVSKQSTSRKQLKNSKTNRLSYLRKQREEEDLRLKEIGGLDWDKMESEVIEEGELVKINMKADSPLAELLDHAGPKLGLVRKEDSEGIIMTVPENTLFADLLANAEEVLKLTEEVKAGSEAQADKEKDIYVKIGEMQTASSGDSLYTYGLGSCLAIVLYDSARQTGAMAHAILPSFVIHKDDERLIKFIDYVIPVMLGELEDKGSKKEDLVAGLFGGASMFPEGNEKHSDIGAMNIQAAQEILQRHNIPVVAEDVGGEISREVFFDLKTGEVKVKFPQERLPETFSLGEKGPSLPDGSPLEVFKRLRVGTEMIFPEEIRLETKGEMPDGHLSLETVKRDLNTLVFLGLVEKFGIGDDAAYLPLKLIPGERDFVKEVLMDLGTRPTAQDKKKAKTQLAFINGIVKGLDMRPVEARLLHAAYVADDMAVKSIINPENKPLVGVYGGAGADVSNFLLSTNAKEAYFVSYDDVLEVFNNTEPEDYRALEGGSLKNLWEEDPLEYGRKFHVGFAAAWNIVTSHEKIHALKRELDAINATDIKADLHEGHPRLKFKWGYYGEESKERSITFINADITHPEKYPELLNKVLTKGVDVYYQRAGLRIPKAYLEENNFIHYIYERVNAGGFFVTDDYSFREDGEKSVRLYTARYKDFPIKLPVIPVPGRDRLRPVVARVREVMPSHSYGWEVIVRRKEGNLGGLKDNVRVGQKTVEETPINSKEWMEYLKGDHTGIYAQVAENSEAHKQFDEYIEDIYRFNNMIISGEVEPADDEEKSLMVYSLSALTQIDPERIKNIGELARRKMKEFTSPEIDREEIEAQDFIDALINWIEARALDTGVRGEELIIGIGSSWMPEVQRDLASMQKLLKKIENLSKSKLKGLKSIKVIIEENPQILADEVWDARKGKDSKAPLTPLSNIIILENENVLEGEVFRAFRGSGDKERSFFAKIKLPEDFYKKADTVDINIVKMVTEMLERASVLGAMREFYIKLPEMQIYESLHELSDVYAKREEAMIRA